MLKSPTKSSRIHYSIHLKDGSNIQDLIFIRIIGSVQRPLSIFNINFNSNSFNHTVRLVRQKLRWNIFADI